MNGRKKGTIKVSNMDALRVRLMKDPPKTKVFIAKVMDDGQRKVIGVFSGDSDEGFVWRSEPLLQGTPIDPFTGAITCA